MKAFPLLALAAALFTAPTAAATAPGATTTVCAEMESRGNRLRSGDPGGFYFVRGLGGSFPVPSFFEVVPPSSEELSIAVEALEPPGAPALSTGEAARRSSNSCNWLMSIAFGPRSSLQQYAGTEEEIHERTMDSFSIGDTAVHLLRDESGLASVGITSMIAVNDEGYARIHTSSPEAALWLLQLFEALKSAGK